jgi:hypothetical protein
MDYAMQDIIATIQTRLASCRADLLGYEGNLPMTCWLDGKVSAYETVLRDIGVEIQS